MTAAMHLAYGRGGVISSNITDLGESSIEKNSKKTDGRIIDLTKPGVGVSNVLTEKIKSLPTIRTKLKPHCIERCAERGITKTMAEKVFEKGLRYYDPKNQSITYM